MPSTWMFDIIYIWPIWCPTTLMKCRVKSGAGAFPDLTRLIGDSLPRRKRVSPLDLPQNRTTTTINHDPKNGPFFILDLKTRDKSEFFCRAPNHSIVGTVGCHQPSESLVYLAPNWIR